MAGISDPPKRRYRLHLELDAHDVEGALRELQVIVNDAEIDGLPTECVSSAGYVLRWEERNPDMTAERYAEELEAWRQTRKAR